MSCMEAPSSIRRPERLVYIASRLRAYIDLAGVSHSLEENLVRAMRLCREVALTTGKLSDGQEVRYIPLASHVFCVPWLDDTVPEEREAGMRIGRAMLAACDEVWVDSTQGISEGIRAEVALADWFGIRVVVKWGSEMRDRGPEMRDRGIRGSETTAPVPTPDYSSRVPSDLVRGPSGV